MANHKSSDKRTRQDKTKTAVNRRIMTAVRTYEKKFLAAVEADEKEEAEKLFKTYESRIDRAAKKGVVHKNNASRKVSRLAAKMSNKMSKKAS